MEFLELVCVVFGPAVPGLFQDRPLTRLQVAEADQLALLDLNLAQATHLVDSHGGVLRMSGVDVAQATGADEAVE